MLDVRPDPSVTTTCPDSTVPTSGRPDRRTAHLRSVDVGHRSQRGTVENIFLDLGGGDVVMIVIDFTYLYRYDIILNPQAMPIAESFTFK